MGKLDHAISKIAADQRFLVTRDDVLRAGGGKPEIHSRIEGGIWLRVHPGVYQVDRRPLEWEDRLLAAVLACGSDAVASHRAAMTVWGLDGIRSAPLEVTMPFGNLGFPEGVLVHRTRRPFDRNEMRGIPVTSVERTLLDVAGQLPVRVVGKALDSALRMGLTDIPLAYECLSRQGGRGVRGSRRMRLVLADRMYDGNTDSGAEFDLLHFMRLASLPMPELDHELFPRGGRRIPDFFWPDKSKTVEVDGIDAHSSAVKLDDDLERQNAIMDLGIEIRRFSARRVRRDPRGVVEEIRRFLDS